MLLRLYKLSFTLHARLQSAGGRRLLAKCFVKQLSGTRCVEAAAFRVPCGHGISLGARGRPSTRLPRGRHVETERGTCRAGAPT